MSDENLRLRAREAIRSNRIPARLPERMWGGAAETADCKICRSPVGGLGLDLEFDRGDGVVRYPVHVDCFAAWKLECEPTPPN